MKHLFRPLATAIAAALQLAATAAVPVAWTNSPGMPPYPIKPVPHGSTVDLAVTLKGYTTPPIADGADVRLWYQTNGMGSAWWSAPATFDGSTITASFGPAQDCGADRVSLFFGAPSNVFASAVLRLTHAPGFAPASLPLPVPVLDFSAVELRNLSALTNGWSFGSTPGNYSVVSNRAMNANGNFLAVDGPFFWEAEKAISLKNGFLTLDNTDTGGTMLNITYSEVLYGYSKRAYWEDIIDAANAHAAGDYVTPEDVTAAATAATNYTDWAIQHTDPAIPVFDVYAEDVTNVADFVTSAAISTNNDAFVEAVRSTPLTGADPSDLAEIGEYGSYGTIGAAILALIAGLAALKRRMGTAETAISGLSPKYPMVGVMPSNGTLTVEPYTVATYTAGDSAIAFTVSVGTGETGKARDCELVVDCTATGAIAPTVTWPSNFHPRTDADDFACEAGVRNVYYISEYATGEFVVGGWQETTGGNT